MITLRTKTPDAWAERAAASLPDLVADHAACELQAAVFALALVGRYPGDPLLVDRLSALAAEYERYPLSGEINSTVDDQAATLAGLEAEWGGADGVTVAHLGGLTVSRADWAVNVRPSNTEPLLRLNVEGRDTATMQRVRDAVLAQIRRTR